MDLQENAAVNKEMTFEIKRVYFADDEGHDELAKINCRANFENGIVGDLTNEFDQPAQTGLTKAKQDAMRANITLENQQAPLLFDKLCEQFRKLWIEEIKCAYQCGTQVRLQGQMPRETYATFFAGQGFESWTFEKAGTDVRITHRFDSQGKLSNLHKVKLTLTRWDPSADTQMGIEEHLQTLWTYGSRCSKCWGLATKCSSRSCQASKFCCPSLDAKRGNSCTALKNTSSRPTALRVECRSPETPSSCDATQSFKADSTFGTTSFHVQMASTGAGLFLWTGACLRWESRASTRKESKAASQISSTPK